MSGKQLRVFSTTQVPEFNNAVNINLNFYIKLHLG